MFINVSNIDDFLIQKVKVLSHNNGQKMIKLYLYLLKATKCKKVLKFKMLKNQWIFVKGLKKGDIRNK